MIVTITFSPSIDKSTTISELVPEKKLRCAAPKLQPGGGGINVARAIKKLGGEATAIFPSGGYTGKFFNHLLQLESVNAVIIEAKNETRENFVVLDQITLKQYRFGMPSNALNENEINRCLSALESLKDLNFIVVSGSLPPGVPLDIYAHLSNIAKTKKSKLIIDTSGDALVSAFKVQTFLIKPNLKELASLAHLENIDVKDAEHVAKSLISKNTCDIIVVSLGADGAMMVTKTETHRVFAPKVEVKSTVGAGDSMLAGIVYGMSLGFDLKRALQYGVACGSAATINEGTDLCIKEDVEKLFDIIQKF